MDGQADGEVGWGAVCGFGGCCLLGLEFQFGKIKF